MSETLSHSPPDVERADQPERERAENSPEVISDDQVEQIGNWVDSRVEELMQGIEAGDKSREQIGAKVAEIFKAGLAVGYTQRAVEATEGRRQAAGRYVLPEDEIDQESLWEILTKDYLPGERGIAAAWKRGGIRADRFTRKLDRLIDKFDVWFNNKFMPPPEGQVWKKVDKGWKRVKE